MGDDAPLTQNILTTISRAVEIAITNLKTLRLILERQIGARSPWPGDFLDGPL